jgi:hypothetical protein
VVCQGFKGGEFRDLPLEGGFDHVDVARRGAGGLRDGDSVDLRSTIVPFVACGDLSGYTAPGGGVMDADKSYPLENTATAVVAPPIRPPYEKSIAKAKEARSKKA